MEQTTPTDNGYITVWDSPGQDGSFYGVYGQRYDSSDNPIGAEFQINTHTYWDQNGATVTGLKDGGFVVTWWGEDSATGDASGAGISGQRFGADGNAVGDEFLVNTHTSNDQYAPSVTGLSDGGFVVAWFGSDPATDDGSEEGISGQRFSADGNAVGDEFLVNTHTNNSQTSPSVAGLRDGGYVVTWHGEDSATGDASRYGISGQRFGADGNAVGDEFLVNTHTNNSQTSSSVTGLSTGGFVVAWVSYDSATGDAFAGISGQRFDASGNAVGTEFLVNAYTNNVQSTPSVTGLSDGGFVVTWQSQDTTTGDASYTGIAGQRFDVDGNAVGDEFLVNTHTDNRQYDPSVSGLSDGGVVVTWWGYGSDAGDTSGTGVYGQHFDAVGNKVGEEFLVNTHIAESQGRPDIATQGYSPVYESEIIIHQAPEVGDLTVVGTEDDTAITERFNGTDVDGDALIYTITSDLSEGEGSVVNNNDGTFSFTPGDDFQDLNDGESRDVSFTYIATDTKGNVSNTANVTLTVNGLTDTNTVTDNGYVVVWASKGQDGSDYGIYGQRYDSADNPSGDEFKVNTHTTSYQDFPSVASLRDGGFVVTWDGYDPATGDTFANGIAGQRFDVDGNAVGDEFLVNTHREGSQAEPSVTGLVDGGFVVTWYGNDSATGDTSRYGTSGQRFDASGNTVGDEFLVNTHTDHSQFQTSVAGLGDGGFVVTWYGYDIATGDTSGSGISGQRFDTDGNKVGGEFLVNTHIDNGQYNSSVAGLNNGGFVVTWYSHDNATGDTSETGIFGQRFDAAGNAMGAEFLINSHTENGQADPSVTSLRDGGFVVTWRSYDNATGDLSQSGISGQRFDASGNAVGDEFLVNSFTDGYQLSPSVTGLGDGGFLVTWYGYDSASGDASTTGISAQRFDAEGNKVGNEFLVNTHTDNAQESPDIATLGYSPVFDSSITSNQAPEVSDITASGTEDDAEITADFDGVDADGDALTYTITSGLSEGEGSVVNNNDGTFSFVPGDDFQDLVKGESRDVTFTYTAADETGNVSSAALVTITVNGEAEDEVDLLDLRNAQVSGNELTVEVWFNGASEAPVGALGWTLNLMDQQGLVINGSLIASQPDFDLVFAGLGLTSNDVNDSFVITGSGVLDTEIQLGSFTYQLPVGTDYDGLCVDLSNATAGIVQSDESLLEIALADESIISTSGFSIDGIVSFWADDSVMDGVIIELLDNAGNRVDVQTTNAQGAYQFDEVAKGEYQLSLSLTAQENNTDAVTAVDASTVARMAVDLMQNAGEYQKIAADVDGDGSVSAVDASMIARQAVGLIEPGSWKLVPELDAQYLAELAADPDNDSSVVLTDVHTNLQVSDDISGINYVAVLPGDVNGSWQDTLEPLAVG
ncbi:MAG: Ig-like domain-containing protein [Pontibacterium sp.]